MEQGHRNLRSWSDSWIRDGTYRGGFIVLFSTWRWVFWATSAAAVGIQVVGLIRLCECHALMLLRIRRARLARETGNKNLHTIEKAETLTYKLFHAFERPIVMFFTQPIVFCMAIKMTYLFRIMYRMFDTFQRSELLFTMKALALVA